MAEPSAPAPKRSELPAHDPAYEVLRSYDLGAIDRVAPLGAGLINRTLLVEAASGRWVLQRVNPIFSPLVHEDIAAVAAHLEGTSVRLPRLRRTRRGRLWVEHEDSSVWRLMEHLRGRTLERAQSPRQLASAAGLVARFHAALADCSHRFRSTRLGVHDTPRHLRLLREAVRDHEGHRLASAVAPLAARILALTEGVELGDVGHPRRVVHGDLKISNLLFAEDGDEAVALLDLDTLARGSLAVELGDALRSWCNPLTEDDPDAHLDMELLEASLSGYAAEASEDLTQAEWLAVIPTVFRIALELAARFARDALEERYFGWDALRFAAAGEHNLQRAAGQLALTESIRSQLGAAQALAGSLAPGTSRIPPGAG